MLCFNIRWHHQIPEIDKGSGDLESLTSSGDPALLNAAGHAPTMTTLGAIYAEEYVGQGSWTIAEYMVVVPPTGQNPPPLASDQRHPADFRLRMRNPTDRFAGLTDFQGAVIAFRAQHGAALPCMEALGRRYTDLQTSGFTNASQGVETRDLYSSTGSTIGCAFLARTSATTTTQHWVLFDNRAFDDVKSVKRSQSYASVQAFLSAMQALRDSSPVAFRHAYEEATHYFDVPWSV